MKVLVYQPQNHLRAGTSIICNNTGGLVDQVDESNSWGIGINPKVRKLSG